MEIVNEGQQVEWHRLWALVRLVAELETPTRQEVINLLQPPPLIERFTSKEPLAASSNTYRVAIDTGLIQEKENKTLVLGVKSKKIASEAAFQDCMRNIILGVTERHQSNYLFNLFSSWYAVQDTRILLDLAGPKCFAQFNADMSMESETDEQRLFNPEKFSGWRKWAIFLGLGWSMRINGRDVVVPDATRRLRSALPTLFQEDKHMTLEQFINRLGSTCPELDNGKLFNYCWQASRGSEERGNKLSLMLSTGLRTLDKLQAIRLEYRADSLNIWQLYPAQGSVHQQVTHIEYLEK